MGKTVEAIDSIGIKLFVGCTERTSVVSTFRHCFVCLRCVVPVSMHYKLCLVTVRMEVLQNGRLVNFQSRQTVGERLAAASVTKMATLLGISRASVSEVMTATTYHGTTSSAKKNNARKPKLSDRDCRALKRIVSKYHKTTTAQGAVELKYSL